MAAPFDWPVLTGTPRLASAPDMMVPTVTMGQSLAGLEQAVRRPHPLPSGETQASWEERAREAAVKRLEGENPSDVRKDLARSAVAVDPDYFMRDEDYAAADATSALELLPSGARSFDWPVLGGTPRAPGAPDMMIPTVPLGLSDERLAPSAATPRQEPHGRFGPGFRANTEATPEALALFKTPMREHGQHLLLSLGGDNPSPLWRQTVNEIMGTEGGLYVTGIGAIDFLPFVGNAIGIEEAIRNDDPLAFLLAMLPVAKAAGAAMKGVKGAARPAMHAAEPAASPALNAAGNVVDVAGNTVPKRAPSVGGRFPEPSGGGQVPGVPPEGVQPPWAFAQGSRETISGKRMKHMPELATAPWDVQKAYDDGVAKIIFDQQGHDRIAKGFGMNTAPHFQGPGIFGGNVVPGRQTQVVVGTRPYNTTRKIHPQSAQAMDAIESSYGLAMGQDAVAHSISFPALRADANGVEISLGRVLDYDEARRLITIPGVDLDRMAIVPTPTGVRVLNLDYRPEKFQTLIQQFSQELQSRAPQDVLISSRLVGNKWNLPKQSLGQRFLTKINKDTSLQSFNKTMPDIAGQLRDFDQYFARQHGFTLSNNLQELRTAINNDGREGIAKLAAKLGLGFAAVAPLTQAAIELGLLPPEGDGA